MAFSVRNRADIANGMRTFGSRMEAKSHHLHGALRQDVPASPDLVGKRRRAEARRLVAELAGKECWQ